MLLFSLKMLKRKMSMQVKTFTKLFCIKKKKKEQTTHPQPNKNANPNQTIPNRLTASYHQG